MHEMPQHRHEGLALAGPERRQNQPLCRGNRGLNVADQPAARRRDGQRFGASIDRAVEALDQLFLFQAAHHVADGRAVEGDDIAQRRLIDTRMIVDGDESRILHRRDVEFLGLIEEQRKRNLLQPTNQMARRLEKVIVVV